MTLREIKAVHVMLCDIFREVIQKSKHFLPFEI